MRQRETLYVGEHPPIEQLAQKLVDARIILRVLKPFYSLVILSLKFQHSYKIPTTAVTHDGKFLWNPFWVDHLSLDDLVFEEAHEAWHVCQSCISRGQNIHQLNPTVWNRASDDITDTLLTDDGLKQSNISREMVPPSVMAEARIDKTIEVRYDRLNQKQAGKPQSNSNVQQVVQDVLQSLSQDDPSDIVGTPKDSKQFQSQNPGCVSMALSIEAQKQPKHAEIEANNNRKVQHTILSAKMIAESSDRSRGSIPGAIEDWVATLSKPVIRWSDYIRYMARKVYRRLYTYKRVSYRRGGDTNLRFPVMRPKTGTGTLVMFDGSGSCATPEIVDKFVSEVGGILKICGCPEVWMMFHDVKVYHVAPFSKSELSNLKITGGGTSHIDCFNVLDGKGQTIKSLPFKPDLIIAMTDMESSFPKTPPNIPVIWCGVAGHFNKSYYPGYGTMVEIPWKSN